MATSFNREYSTLFSKVKSRESYFLRDVFLLSLAGLSD